MLFSFHGLWISVALIVLLIGIFFCNFKPKFILPSRYIDARLLILRRIFIRISLCIVVVLPLRFSFVRDQHIVVEKDFPVQVVLDVSLSMSATDFVPSRFAVAKQSLISLVQSLDGYAVSFITFSWKPFVYIPFSSDVSALVAKLDMMNLGDFPPVQDFLWTAIGDALLLAVSNLQQFFDQETYKPGIVILVTDGDSNLGFDPMDIVKFYQKIHVPLYILWVGQENFLIWHDWRNDAIMTDIHPAFLEDLADVTWGKFYRILDAESFDYFLQDFLADVVARQRQTIQKTYRELNSYLVYLLVCTILGLLVLHVLDIRKQLS